MKALIFFASLWSCGLSFMCLDSNGNSVDWYAVYKTPKERQSSDWKFQKGLALYYLDVHIPDRWTVTPHAANETQQAIYNTLAQIYDAENNDNIMYIMYNDESPIELFQAVSRGGHTKGVVAFDTKSGFWLIHSTPKFPPRKIEGYTWPEGGEDYGQTFLCVSFPIEQLKLIRTQLTFNQPNIYDSHNFTDPIGEMSSLQPPGPPYNNTAILTSVGGQKFTHFAKTSKFGRDLYDALVAPTLKQDLLVETWLRSKGEALESNCTAKYKVMKISAVSLPGGDQFSETKDHAKWAITAPSECSSLTFKSETASLHMADSDKWICIGDINRMVSQFHRGGGTMCLQNPDVWGVFRKAVSDYEACKHQSRYET